MARRATSVLLLTGFGALALCAGVQAQNTAAARPAAPAASSVPASKAFASRPAFMPAAMRISASLLPALRPARTFGVDRNSVATTNDIATKTYAAAPMPNPSGGQLAFVDTQFLYVNYADAARAEFEAITASANRATFGKPDGMSYTKHLGAMQAQFSMGGGDVETSQSSLYNLTRAAAVAEAGVDVSTPDHRFGIRVQGRAMVTQQIMVSLPVPHQINVLVPEYPSMLAYVHF